VGKDLRDRRKQLPLTLTLTLSPHTGRGDEGTAPYTHERHSGARPPVSRPPELTVPVAVPID